MSRLAQDILKIPVVDDTADVRELMTMQLRLLGYNVIEATNGREVVEVARRTCPALILMDIHMPVLDGLSAVRLIRDIKELCEVIIVAFSAFGNGGNRERAFGAGWDEYVSKTEGIKQFSNIVRRYLPVA